MTIGVLGGGQLGRMLALAGYRLGYRFRFLDTSGEAPAGNCGELIAASTYQDEGILNRFAEKLTVATAEFENVPADVLRYLADLLPVFPSADAFELAQDRLLEKDFFCDLGIATPRYMGVASLGELEAAVEGMGLPAVLKTRRLGYDGKGQIVISNKDEVAPAWQKLCAQPLILEGFVPFQRELSLISVRNRAGEITYYPLIENTHRDGILAFSIAPAPSVSRHLEEQARDFAQRIMRSLNYVGVLAIEFFEHDGALVANEMAPRVHNSGHWTIEGAATSQFENHLRAILNLPLGSCEVNGHALMINIIGKIPAREKVLGVRGAHLHLYGKSEAPRRKLGHVTIVDKDLDRLLLVKDSLGRMLKWQ